MRLKKSFICQELGQTRFLVSMDPENFRGFMRGNETTGFILDRLSQEISREDLIRAIAEEYDAPEDVIARDTDSILDKLRSMNALEE